MTAFDVIRLNTSPIRIGLISGLSDPGSLSRDTNRPAMGLKEVNRNMKDVLNGTPCFNSLFSCLTCHTARISTGFIMTGQFHQVMRRELLCTKNFHNVINYLCQLFKFFEVGS